MRLFTYPAVLALGALVFLAGCRPSAPATPTGLSLTDVAEYDALLEDLGGLDARAVVVNVWATWCGPCIAEFPELIRYDEAMEGRGVEVRFLSVDDPTIRPDVMAFLEQRNWDEPSYLAMSQNVVDGLATAANWQWDGSIPISFIVADGQVRDAWIGATTYDLIAARVDRVLAAAPAGETASR